MMFFETNMQIDSKIQLVIGEQHKNNGNAKIILGEYIFSGKNLLKKNQLFRFCENCT